MGRTTWLLPLCALACVVVKVAGHGRMLLPPSRASAWRLGVPGAKKDYNDNEAFCGGREHQHLANGGKCGICGDPWDQQPPRDHERPDGKFVMRTDFILSTYRQGDILTAEIQITAAHLGFFEFYLCNVDTLPSRVEATHECLHEHKLYNTNNNSYVYQPLIDKADTYSVHLQLPQDLICSHCVLQWRYHTGNSWGTEANGNSCVGCGPQEEFYACADLRITRPDGSLPTTPVPPPTTPRPPVEITTVDYIPDGLQNDKYPLSEKDKKFFLCNYCAREVFQNQVNSWDQVPRVCIDFGFPRACPR